MLVMAGSLADICLNFKAVYLAAALLERFINISFAFALA